MLENILNLEGVTVLNKKQQGSISGGQVCKFVIIYKGGGRRSALSGGYSEGQAGSSEANDDCTSLVVAKNDVKKCYYDCEYDDFGQ